MKYKNLKINKIEQKKDDEKRCELNGQEKWNKLINFTEEYEPDPNLAKAVIKKIMQNKF